MFGFKRKSAVQRPSAEICRALSASGLPAGCNDPADAFRVVEQQGKYSGRKVTHVRIFAPAAAAARNVTVGAYGDLDVHPDLILWTGRMEHFGTVNITRQSAAPSVRTTNRQAADLAAHGDVAHLLDQSAARGEHERYSRDGADTTP
jgi:hypothetical protein